MTKLPPRPAGHIIQKPLVGDRRLQILLTLGLLGPMRQRQLQRICAPDLGERGLQWHLKALFQLGWLWRHPLADPLGNPMLQQPWLYGLAPEGVPKILEYVPVESSRLIVKEGRVITTQRAIWSHMLDQAEFISLLIADLRRHPAFLGINVQPEYTALKLIRIDGLLTIRFARRGGMDAIPVPQRRPWWVPWLLLDTTYPYDERFHMQRRIALEVDRSTEELSIIQKKGEDYRNCYMHGGWMSVLGSFPIPAFLVRSEPRLRSIHDAWARGWWGTATPTQTTSVLAATFDRLEQSVVLGRWVNEHGSEVDFFGQPLAAQAS